MHPVFPQDCRLLQGKGQSGGRFNGCLLFTKHYMLGVVVEQYFSGFRFVLTRNSWATSPLRSENSIKV